MIYFNDKKEKGKEFDNSLPFFISYI
jgi:hypothetical protein